MSGINLNLVLKFPIFLAERFFLGFLAESSEGVLADSTEGGFGQKLKIPESDFYNFTKLLLLIK